MKLALAQINTTVGDLEGNVNRVLDAARSVPEADLVIFPELTVPGYPPRDILYDATFIEAVGAATNDLVTRSKGLPPLLFGSLERSGIKLYEHPALYNTAFLVKNGKLQAAQFKQLLPVYDVFYEPRWFVPGERTLPPVEIVGKKLGVLICEDMWDEEYPVHPGADLKAMGADILVCISASPYRKGAVANRLHHARRQGLPLVFVNSVGANDELIFDGRSFVLEGERCRQFEEEVRKVTIDDGRQTVVDGPSSMVEQEEVFHALVLGLRDFARKNGLKKGVIGLSGGIDSAVAAVIAVEALGASNVTAIAIPSRFTDPRSTQTAREMAEALDMPFEVVELEGMHLASEQSLGPERSAGVIGENLQARLRMMVLMSFVNQGGGFLINTSNKTELTVGYSTLYGDAAGAISPLGDLTKPEVYKLAHWINEKFDGVIPEFILTRKPSAELKDGQVDPFDYDVISPELEALVRENRSNASMRASEHKRWQTGLVLKVSEKAFGRGRMMPITRK